MTESKTQPQIDEGASVLNIPNLLCLIRLLGSPILCWLAWRQPQIVVWVLILLLSTDWVDGKLAILFKQRTVLGAILDSAADATLFVSVLFCAGWLRSAEIWGEVWWIVAAVASYVGTCGAAWWKFGRLPSYHTWSAKTAWWICSIAAVTVIGGWAVWPLRLAAAAVTLANFEGMAITSILPRWQADVRSISRALKIRRAHDRNPPKP